MFNFTQDFSVYKAIVIDNYDTLYPMSGRVQVFIPAVHVTQLESLFKGSTNYSFRFVGNNIQTALTKDVVDQLKTFCPWCVPGTPVTGDTGSGFYDAEQGVASVTEADCISLDAVPNPAQSFSTAAGILNTASPYANPSQFMVRKGDVNAYSRAPALSNLPKGNFTVPRVGASLLVTFFEGNINFPVYIGALPDIYDFSSVMKATGLNNPDSQTSTK